jgi:hypothetical protein
MRDGMLFREQEIARRLTADARLASLSLDEAHHDTRDTPDTDDQLGTT